MLSAQTALYVMQNEHTTISLTHYYTTISLSAYTLVNSFFFISNNIKHM